MIDVSVQYMKLVNKNNFNLSKDSVDMEIRTLKSFVIEKLAIREDTHSNYVSNKY